LKSIHDAKVLHRDLRLENLLVLDSGDIAIIDFDRAMLAAEDGLDEEYEELARLLEDLVVDHIEAAETSGFSGKGKIKTVEVTETEEASWMRTGRHEEVTEDAEGMPETVAPTKIKFKARAVSATDAAPKSGVRSQTKTKTDMVEMELKRRALAGRINDDDGPYIPRMSGKMVLRPKPPKVSR